MTRKNLTRNSFKNAKDGIEIALLAGQPYVGFFEARTGRLLAQVSIDDLFDADGNRFDLSQLGERDA